MPGRGNAIAHGTGTVTNWWAFTGDWDGSVNAGMGLHTGGSGAARATLPPGMRHASGCMRGRNHRGGESGSRSSLTTTDLLETFAGQLGQATGQESGAGPIGCLGEPISLAPLADLLNPTCTIVFAKERPSVRTTLGTRMTASEQLVQRRVTSLDLEVVSLPQHLLTLPLALLSIVSVGALAAQTESLPFSPLRVRVTVPVSGVDKYAGVMTAVRGDSIAVDNRWFPLSTVTRLEVSHGRRSYTLLGGGIGFLAGGLAGAKVGSSVEECPEDLDPQVCTAGGAAAGAIVGFLFGAIVGSLITSERWEAVPVERLRVTWAGPRDGSLALAASVRF